MVLVGFEMPIDIGYEISNEYMMNQQLSYSPQKTITISPQYSQTLSQQVSIQNAPQIVLGSPNASIGSGAALTPLVYQIPTQSVGVTPVSTTDQAIAASQSAEQGIAQGETTDYMQYLVLGVALVGGLYLWQQYKKKKKGKRKSLF